MGLPVADRRPGTAETLPDAEALNWAVYGLLKNGGPGVVHPTITPAKLEDHPGWPTPSSHPTKKGLHLLRRALPEIPFEGVEVIDG